MLMRNKNDRPQVKKTVTLEMNDYTLNLVTMCFYLQSYVQTFYGLKLVKVTCNKKLCSSLVRNVRVLFVVPRVIFFRPRAKKNPTRDEKARPFHTRYRNNYYMTTKQPKDYFWLTIANQHTCFLDIFFFSK